MAFITSVLSRPAFVFSIIALVSFSALAAAFIAEGFLGLEPCKLCIYQRYPFAIGLVIALIGLTIKSKPALSRAALGVCSLNFMINSAIATYHTGVEQKWWESDVDGCKVTFPGDDSSQSFLDNIMSAPMGSCSEIPWQDPILGLSMANYNIALCFGLCIFCVLGAVLLKPQTALEPSEQTQ